MATRSFLLSDECEAGIERLLGSFKFPKQAKEMRAAFAPWLEERLLHRLNEFGSFEALDPVLLGSWARGELCPKSDIDLLFLGEEKLVKEFVAKAFAQGVKLRARTPEDKGDWTKGVEPFDILALHSALAIQPETEARVQTQRARVAKFRRTVLSSIKKERAERRLRQDSVASLLEPNLKFGIGGLRDIEQALALARLFPERFAGLDPYPFGVLESIKDQLLVLRTLLHLKGSGDVFTAQDQLDLAKLLGFEAPKQLMTHIQSELERASFYGDWVVAVSSEKQVQVKPVKTWREAIQRLREKPDLLNQFEIRRSVENLHKGLSTKARGEVLEYALERPCDDAFLISLYRTRLVEMWLPDFVKLRGLVQHDHYHRYTADAHLVQCLREVERARQRGRSSLGQLNRLTKELSHQDWYILKLTALFHDLAKGRKEDHSTAGARLANEQLSAWGLSDQVRSDVVWLVENHLLLSTAAFRQNPQSQSTWKRLFERGVEGRRLTLLALFTALDIRATNPDAWTDWKSQLLMNLVSSMRSKPALSMGRHLSYARRKGFKSITDKLVGLDPLLFENLKPQVLIDDLEHASRAKDDLPPKVVAGTKGRLWVRFHAREDATGVFLSFVQKLFGFGLAIQTASVHTIVDAGVYDWFCLRTEKSARQVSAWLAVDGGKTSSTKQESIIPKVEFQDIELVAEDESEWILSFRGRDQRGLLLAAADALAAENLSLRWARAHTWGQQIEDIFSVQPAGDSQKIIADLRRRFVT